MQKAKCDQRENSISVLRLPMLSLATFGPFESTSSSEKFNPKFYTKMFLRLLLLWT